MNLKFFPSIFLMLNVVANIENDFLTDYFVYKKISMIVGFSCNKIKDDFSLFNRFSKKGIVTALYKLNNLKNLNAILNVNYWKIGVFLDVRCYDYKTISSIFFEAAEYRMFDELRYWLVIGSNRTEVLKVIDDRAFGVSTDFVIALPSGNQNYELYDTYNLFKDHGRILNVTYLGSWNLKTGFNISLTQPKFQRRSNLHRLRLKAIFFKCSYKVGNMKLEDYFEDYENATKDGQAKFGYHLISHLAELYNFSIESHESLEWMPGDSIGPVAQAIMNNTVDITGSPLIMNVARTYFVNYVHQDWPFRTCFIFRNPQQKTIKLHEILTPLTDEVWFVMFLLAIIIFVTLFVILKNEGIKSTVTNVSNALLITVGALCQQGTEESMTRISTRITFLFIMIFSLLVYNYYSASVVSARLGEPIFKINDSLVEFGKMRLKMSSEPMVYLEYFLKRKDWETHQFYKKYWSKLPVSSHFMIPEIGIRLVQKGGFAYHMHPDVGYQLIEKLYSNREICELMEVHLGRPTFTAFGVTMNSSIAEIARVGLTKISETGLKYRQIARWQYRKPRCRKNILTVFSVTIYEFAPHLLLLILGMVTSAITYFVEFWVANYGGHSKIKLIKWRKKYLSCERIIEY